MQVFHTNHPAFKNLLACFQEFPKVIPAYSVMVCDENKPISLVCIYYDANVFFIHGLYKSRDSSAREFLKSVKFVEKYLTENVSPKISVVTLTNKRALKNIFIKNNFKSEEITLLFRGIQ
jgi:hypothetical protein